MKNYLVVLVLFFGVLSCKKKCHHHSSDDLCNVPQFNEATCISDTTLVKSLILGKWNWTQTQTWSWQENTDNPCTKNLNYDYEFLNNGKVNIYIDGSYSSAADYHFTNSWAYEITIEDSVFSTHPEVYYARGTVQICGKYLVIDNSPVDGPKMIFKRAD